MSSTLSTTDPRTGVRSDTGIEATSDEAVDAIVEQALGAAEQLGQHDGRGVPTCSTRWPMRSRNDAPSSSPPPKPRRG
ncbi:hypothetical protein [Agromyces flavus]|uniref:hypothetical protein n=1 Tax=Agromyces flavus TaxID=589382 RepID=UPI0036143100